MEFSVVCHRCGKTFLSKSTQGRWCPECKPILLEEQKERKRASEKQRRKIKKEMQDMAIQKRSLGEVALKARAAGMTYGQYVAKYGEVEK